MKHAISQCVCKAVVEAPVEQAVSLCYGAPGSLGHAARAVLCVLVLSLAAVNGCQTYVPPPSEAEVFEAVGDFTFTERSGREVSRSDLHGKVWIASFVFTRCCTSCPHITKTLAQLQAELEGRSDVVIVSFSVDPEHDTPEILRRYADGWKADAERWLFLTGDKANIYSLCREHFHLPVQENEGESRQPGDEVSHSDKLAVVDRRGRIRGYFDGADGKDIPRVKRLIEKLLREGPMSQAEQLLPAVNALLNTTSAVLLIVGYLAVRRRKLTLHAACMTGALLVSSLFLASYLYYHFVVKDGQPTPFTGTGWIRPTYFAILLTHTVLAVVVAPLALITAYLGYRGLLSRHVKLARWTLPIWLYVSGTGVVIYLLLYHAFPSP